MGRVLVSQRYGVCLYRGEGGEGKILKRKRGKYEWRDEGRGGREQHRRRQSRVIKVLDGRERGSWRTATERRPRSSERFSVRPLPALQTHRASFWGREVGTELLAHRFDSLQKNNMTLNSRILTVYGCRCYSETRELRFMYFFKGLKLKNNQQIMLNASSQVKGGVHPKLMFCCEE